MTGSPWVKFLQLRFQTHYGTEPVCAVNDVTVHGRGANEDLEELLSTDGDTEVPLVIPLPSVSLPLVEQPAKAPAAATATAVAEQGGAVPAADLADVRNGSNDLSAAQLGAQGGALDTAAAAPVLRAEAAAALTTAAAAGSSSAPAEAAYDAASPRSGSVPQLVRSNDSSVAAAPEAAASPDASLDTARAQPDGGPASQSPGQLTPAAAVAASDKPAAGSAGQHRPPPAQTPAAPAVTADPVPTMPVESVPTSSVPALPRPVAVPPADAAPARTAARAELEFMELPVGSGRSGGGIYDVLVQARALCM